MMTARKLETMTETEVETLKRDTYRAFFQAAAADRPFFLANLETISRRQAELLRGLS